MCQCSESEGRDRRGRRWVIQQHRSIEIQQCEQASSIASHAAGHPILYSGGICVVASCSTESCQAVNLSAVVSLLWDLTPINILSERESCDFLWHLAAGPPVSMNSAGLCLWRGRGILVIASLLSSLLFNVCFCGKGSFTVTLIRGQPHFYVNISGVDLLFHPSMFSCDFYSLLLKA